MNARRADLTQNLDIRREQSELAGVFMMLLGDLTICEEDMKQQNAVTYRDRAYARALFALIEGVTYRMRRVLVAGAKQGRFAISASDLRKLREARSDTAQNGTDSQDRAKFLPIREGLKVTLRLWADCFGQKLPDNCFSGNAWAAVLRAIEVRHAVTHPKFANDLVITKARLRDLKGAQSWLMHTMAHLLQALPT